MQIKYENITEVLTEGEMNAQILDELSDNILTNYCSELNDIMNKIRLEIIDAEEAPTTVLERYLLLLAEAIFWATDKLESAEIRTSIHKAIASEAYNRAYMEAATEGGSGVKKPTIAELQAIATQQAMTEQMTATLQSSVRDRIKGRIDAAQCMHRSLTRILARRQEEQNIY